MTTKQYKLKSYIIIKGNKFNLEAIKVLKKVAKRSCVCSSSGHPRLRPKDCQCISCLARKILKVFRFK